MDKTPKRLRKLYHPEMTPDRLTYPAYINFNILFLTLSVMFLNYSSTLIFL